MRNALAGLLRGRHEVDEFLDGPQQIHLEVAITAHSAEHPAPSVSGGVTPAQRSAHTPAFQSVPRGIFGQAVIFTDAGFTASHTSM